MLINFRVVELFDSLEGEGKRAGLPATFIRLAGCNLRCTYCDTAHALANDAGEEMTLEEILKRVNPFYNRVTLTGGEPLQAPRVGELVQALLAQKCEVNIETNGSVDVAGFCEAIGGRNQQLFFTIDYKLPSSGECDKMLEANYYNLAAHDVLKFVVGAVSDISAMLDLLARMVAQSAVMPQVFIGAVAAKDGGYEGISLPALADIILREPLLHTHNARLQLQFHKIIWGHDVHGV